MVRTSLWEGQRSLSEVVFELEEHRRKKVEEIATLIQRTYRGWVKRKRVREGRGRRDR